MRSIFRLFLTLVALNLGLVCGQDGNYVFLVSSVSNSVEWCITARYGVSPDFRNVGFSPCDTQSSPANQLWELDAQGRIHSRVDPNQCLIVNFGTKVFNGVRVRIASCATAGTNNQFSHNGGTDTIKLASDTSYCMTNRGTSPNPTDTMHMIKCGTSGRFLFTPKSGGTPTNPTLPPAPGGGGNSMVLKTNGACVAVRNGNARNDERFILASCDGSTSQGFSMDSGSAASLVRSQLDNTKCMQGGRISPARHGKKLRLFPCDASNPLQLFEAVSGTSTGAKYKLTNTDLCMDHRGTNSNVGVDPIILKSCSTAGEFEK